jgi:hypothetical protein
VGLRELVEHLRWMHGIISTKNIRRERFYCIYLYFEVLINPTRVGLK